MSSPGGLIASMLSGAEPEAPVCQGQYTQAHHSTPVRGLVSLPMIATSERGQRTVAHLGVGAPSAGCLE